MPKGQGDFWELVYSRGDSYTWIPEEQLLEITATLDPIGEPGSVWHYSNAGYRAAKIIIEQVTGEKVTPEDLGGAQSHARYSGVTHFVAQTEDEAFAICKKLLGFLPSNNTDDPPFYEELHDDVVGPNAMLNTIVPENPREAYDMHQVIGGVVDRGDFLEEAEVIGMDGVEGHPGCRDELHAGGAAAVDSG